MRCSISLWRDWRTFRAIVQDRNQGTCYITSPSTHLLRVMIGECIKINFMFSHSRTQNAKKFRHNLCTVGSFIPWWLVYNYVLSLNNRLSSKCTGPCVYVYPTCHNLSFKPDASVSVLVFVIYFKYYKYDKMTFLRS